MPRRQRRHLHHHLSAADERFGLRLGAGIIGMFTASAVFVLLVLLVRSGWPPLRDLDSNAAQAAQRLDGSHPGLVRTAETVSNVFDPNVFRVVLGLIALMYLVRGERRHAVWLLVTVFGGAALGVVLKTLVGRAVRRYPTRCRRCRGACRFRPATRWVRPSAAAFSFSRCDCFRVAAASPRSWQRFWSSGQWQRPV